MHVFFLSKIDYLIFRNRYQKDILIMEIYAEI